MFLFNLETAHVSVGKLISQVSGAKDSESVISQIFPPHSYGYGGKVFDKPKDEDNYNREIESLLQKYSQNYPKYWSKEKLSENSGYGNAKDLHTEML